MIGEGQHPRTVPNCESALEALTFEDLKEVSLPFSNEQQDIYEIPVQSRNQPKFIDQSKFLGSFNRESYSKEGKPGPKSGSGQKIRSKSYVHIPEPVLRQSNRPHDTGLLQMTGQIDFKDENTLFEENQHLKNQIAEL